MRLEGRYEWQLNAGARTFVVRVDPFATRRGASPSDSALSALLWELQGSPSAVLDAVREAHRVLTSTLGSFSGSGAETLERITDDLRRAAKAGRLEVEEIPAQRVPQRILRLVQGPTSRQSVRPEFTTHVTVELVDEDGNPVPRRRVRLELPDGDIREATTNANGVVHLVGIGQAGSATVTFLDLDESAFF